ncbi:MAG: pre-peptidase C-terminal domain-containing protein [Candidatus Marinimicrobia bacterium]|nr:pre-peptidase C-terminal domain-containing protein [Candidatus Neomarinimicrobiota bacterium]
MTLSQPVITGDSVTVNYITADGTAVAPGDYTAHASTQLTFAPGESTKPVNVITVGDSTVEPDETFSVNLSSPSANATITDGTGAGTITNNDQYGISIDDQSVAEGGTAGFTVTLSQPVITGDSVTVNYITADGTAVAPGDYTAHGSTQLSFAPGESTKPVNVVTINDSDVELTETFFVNLSSPSANAIISDPQGECTINVDDQTGITIDDITVNENVGTATFTVSLSVAADDDVTVDYATANGTAVSGSDYTATSGALTINAGNLSGSIDMLITNDAVVEPVETFNIDLTGCSANALITDNQGVATITDNDYTVIFNTATVGPAGIDGGTVNGVLSVTQEVEHGTDCTQVTANPNAGYRFTGWTGDYTGTVNPLTVTNVTSDMTITANFIAIYTITATAGANGTISPSGAVIVDYGTDQTFTFDPNTCYEVDDVSVDLVSEGGEIRNYTFTNVTADHTIDVQFYHYDCTITATAEHGGTITPAGAVTVHCGDSQSFTITAVMGNEIAEVLVDGVDLAIGSGNTTYNYNWTNVKKDDDDTSPCVHYIVAKFKRPALSCMDISDVPLNAMSHSAPANIMFVLDDSGSMDWEIMTDESDGLFGGKCYVFDNPGDNVYTPWYWERGVLMSNRVDYRSQWSGYNRMYYDPNVDYAPWPTFTDADPDNPQSHPNIVGNTLNLHDTYFRILSADDHGDDCAHATPVSCNTQVEGYIEASGDMDYYQVDLTSGGTLTVYTTGYSDTYGYLYNSGCNYITKNDDSGSYNNFRIQYAVPGAGTYFIRVQRYNNTGRGSYTFHVDFTGTFTTHPAPILPANVEIKNAHYYVWSAAHNRPYLVNIDGGSITYYEVNDPAANGGNDDMLVEYSELTLSATPPADVVKGRNYTEERQNFANWYSFYRRRELTATAAIANVITNMKGVNIGLRSINGNLNQPVLKVKVGTVDETNTLLSSLYALVLSAQGTPLRTGLQRVGQYFDDDDSGNTGGIGVSPYATAANGGECQQSFAIVMTDGYWNGTSPGVGHVDQNDGVPYADDYGSTLADVAMYYYEKDLSSTLGPEVPTNPWDDNKQQHMVTYGISFGVTGSLNPNDYDIINGPFPTWPDVHSCSSCNLKIDDLWHASVNGRGFFLSASNPNELVNSLLDIMQNIEAREGSASSVSVNGDELYTKLSGGGDILMFQSSYDTENWTGDVKAYQVCTELTGNCTGKKIGDIIKSPYVWSANEKLGGLNWNTGRKIVTYNGTDAGIPFRWTAGGVTTDQKSALNNDSTLLDYLRGDTTNEAANGGTFRDRFARLGDMVHSSPTFESGVLYAGGNDGMLHAFAAADDEPYAGAVGGRELFAYVPNLVFDNLSQLAEPNYTHKYFVDLTPTVKAGVDISGVSTTVLVGGLAKGGRGYYALDVTDPASWTGEGAIAGKVMWEYPKAGVTDDDMGYSFSKPAIVKCNDASVGWIVIFGNGYNSQNGHAVLYILNPGTGDLIKKIDTNVDGCNGLSTLVPIDVNYDNKVDYVYVGDLRGNVWKFDLTDTDYTNWEVAFYDGEEKPLFQAQGPGGTTQPITAKPDVMYHPTEHGYMVLFSTGQYLGESDISETTAQSFYGIWDYGDDEDDSEYLGSFRRGYGQELSNQPSTVSLLAQQVIPSESPDPNAPDFWTVTINQGQPDEYDLLLRLTTDHDIVWETMADPDGTQNPPEYLPDLSDSVDNHAGWYFDLPLSGERGIVDLMIRGGVIIAISFIPEDTPCGYGGDSVIHEMNAASGARLTRPQFDINGDGVIDDNDRINIGTVANPIWVVPTGMKKAGQLQPPAILIDPDRGVEIKYLSSSSGTIETVYEKPPLLGISYWREFE